MSTSVGAPPRAIPSPPTTVATPGPVTAPVAADPARDWLRVAGVAVLLASGLLLGFLVFLVYLSGLQETRTQDNLYRTFRGELAAATAPVASTTPGRPVALLDIPAIGLHDVVVEGTTSGDLTVGPGHRRDTVLPGQAGTSVVYGRREAFGGPFRRLPDLRLGDRLTTVTGQGRVGYRVVAVWGGLGRGPRLAVNADDLVLVSSAPPLEASREIMVVAAASGRVFPAGGVAAGVPAAEDGLAGDTGGALALMLWGQALLALAVLTAVAARRWGAWPAYVAASPALLAVLWNVSENVARLLPNLL